LFSRLFFFFCKDTKKSKKILFERNEKNNTFAAPQKMDNKNQKKK